MNKEESSDDLDNHSSEEIDESKKIEEDNISLSEYEKIDQISESQKADIAASFQKAVAETLLSKTKNALEKTGLTELVIGGGVASNKYLREKLVTGLNDKNIFFPPIERCTDNGAMIAYAGSFYLKDVVEDLNLKIKPRWPLSEFKNG